MSEIQIKYREGYCEMKLLGHSVEYSYQCHTCTADVQGCQYYDGGRWRNKDGILVIPFGDCIHADWIEKYKGLSVKTYEIEPYHDDYNPNMDCALVHVGRETYECLEVTLNGKKIYPEEEEALKA